MGRILQKPTGRTKTMGEIQALLDQQSSEDAFQEAKDQEELDAAANVSSSSNQLKQNLKDQEKQAVADAKKLKADKNRQQSLMLHLAGLPSKANATLTRSVQNVADQVGNTYRSTKDFASSGWDQLGAIATPGSIWLPVTILLVFFFVVFPVNGHSRFEWWFMAMTGQAEITGVTG